MLLPCSCKRGLPILCWLAVFAAFPGCSSNPQDQRSREEKTRDEAAKAVESAKPLVEEAGKKVGEAAHEAANETRAAARGAREGWNKNRRSTSVDLNSGTQRQLLDLGMTKQQVHEIIVGRPYQDTHELVTKGILSEEQYAKIRDRVAAK